MRERFYQLLSYLAEHLGPGFFLFIAQGIAAGYFILFPGRRAVSIRFYRALYPGRTLRFHRRCAWRQFRNFTTVFLDRHLLQTGHTIHYTFSGREHLHAALGSGQGGILLMSHLGNWEVGARLLHQDIPDLRLMLYVGQRNRDQIERLQKQDLTASGIRIVTVDQEGGSAFDLIEGVSFLKSGGFVSMAGDLIWRPDQRAIVVPLLGHAVRLPEAPYVMAMLAGVPLYVFFTAAKARYRYHFSLAPPLHVRVPDRRQRAAVIQGAAQAYAGLLEQQLKRSPYEWYHFTPFLGPPLAPPKKL